MVSNAVVVCTATTAAPRQASSSAAGLFAFSFSMVYAAISASLLLGEAPAGGIFVCSGNVRRFAQRRGLPE